MRKIKKVEVSKTLYDRKFFVTFKTDFEIYGNVNVTAQLSEKVGSMLSFDEIAFISKSLGEDISDLKDNTIIILNIIECR